MEQDNPNVSQRQRKAVTVPMSALIRETVLNFMRSDVLLSLTEALCVAILCITATVALSWDADHMNHMTVYDTIMYSTINFGILIGLM